MANSMYATNNQLREVLEDLEVLCQTLYTRKEAAMMKIKEAGSPKCNLSPAQTKALNRDQKVKLLPRRARCRANRQDLRQHITYLRKLQESMLVDAEAAEQILKLVLRKKSESANSFYVLQTDDVTGDSSDKTASVEECDKSEEECDPTPSDSEGSMEVLDGDKEQETGDGASVSLGEQDKRDDQYVNIVTDNVETKEFGATFERNEKCDARKDVGDENKKIVCKSKGDMKQYGLWAAMVNWFKNLARKIASWF